MIAIKDLHWAAGFLEGEGSFGPCGGPSRQSGQVRITCHQVETQPLLKLKALFGGHVMGPHRGPNRPIYLWSLQYRAAVSVMMTLYQLFSAKRQKQIRKTLDHWRSFRAHRGTWTECQRGHSLSGDNLYVDTGTGKRGCKTCRRRHSANYREKQKLTEITDDGTA